jgi:hypothetical protein
MMVGMSDGILAISRKEEASVPIEEHMSEETEVAKKRRKKARTYADFTLTEYGVKDQVLTGKFSHSSSTCLWNRIIHFVHF